MKQLNYNEILGIMNEKLADGGVFLNVGGEKPNTMTIGWGHIGIEWGKPIFIAYVRESRHTYTMLEGNGEFTVNIPMGQVDKKILGYCGTKSGRDLDKIAQLGLTLEEGDTVSVPGIKEMPLTLECKVIYQQDQVLDAIEEGIPARHETVPFQIQRRESIRPISE
mgnify:CR=1 FL=1